MKTRGDSEDLGDDGERLRDEERDDWGEARSGESLREE